jgi:exosortase A-associated hydrolase 2
MKAAVRVPGPHHDPREALHMTETPLFFSGGGARLFGVLHQPGQAAARPAFVFCHPFGEEKLWAHRAYVTFARELAALGHPVLRFDYRGNGDSDGAFEESSLDTMIADVETALAYLRETVAPPAINLLGLRFGATVASLVAERQGDIQDLVLWAPIVDGGRYMQELLRINLTTQMSSYKKIVRDRAALVAEMEAGGTVSVDGYELALPLYAQCSSVKLAAEPKTFAGRCLALQIDRAPGAKPLPEMSELVGRYPNATLVCTQEEPFWKEIARYYGTPASAGTITLEWLQRR